MTKINFKKLTKSNIRIILILCGLSILLFYLFVFINKQHVSKLKAGGGSIKVDKNTGITVNVFYPEVEFWNDDSVKTAIIDVTDKATGNKLIGFEVDFIPGKYRWACNSFTKMRNYQNNKLYSCNDVLKSYFLEKIPNKITGSKKIQAILSIGLASQEGILDVQEQLADKRAMVLYDEVNEYIDSEKLKIPRIKLSFGQYTGKSTDQCDEKTDDQRIVSLVRVYDSNTEISDNNYEQFKSLFYEVFELAFKMNKIPLNGLNYSRFQNKNVFLDRRFL